MEVGVQAVRTALIAAGVAALVASSTAGAVALVDSNGIKNGSIRLVDMSPGAIRALKGQRGPRGFEGPMGPAGPAGVAGPIGATGAIDLARISYVTGAPITIIAGSVQNTATAYCPAGSKVVGGGFFSSVGYPYALVPAENGYGALVDAFDSSINGTGYAYAVCVSP